MLLRFSSYLIISCEKPHNYPDDQKCDTFLFPFEEPFGSPSLQGSVCLPEGSCEL